MILARCQALVTRKSSNWKTFFPRRYPSVLGNFVGERTSLKKKKRNSPLNNFGRLFSFVTCWHSMKNADLDFDSGSFHVFKPAW